MQHFQTALERAQALIVKGDPDGAIPLLGEALNAKFYDDETLYLLGGCLIEKGLNGLAAVVTSAAIDVRKVGGKTFPEAMMNLGTAYKREHRGDIAERIWIEALKVETLPKERSKLYSNIAGLYVNDGAPEKAVHYADLALKEDPTNAGVQVNRGLACLELGRWAEGWRGLNHTTLSGDAVRRVYPGIPVWDGRIDKTVIVYGDQGVGDEIYFSDCLRDMQAVCKKVIFDCHPRLPALFQRSFPAIEVHGTRKHLTGVEWLAGCGADGVVALSELPERFRSGGGWSGEAWLKAGDALSIKRPPAGPRIGLSWTGGTKQTQKHLRSLDIAALEPIVRARPDAQWFSLQYQPDAARDVCLLEERTGIRISHFPGWVECFDYDRTASFVASLDLVITVCTTAHHLGGALGVPTWTLVPKHANWRYCSGGTDRVPWYNSARLFRQIEQGDWSAPINSVVQELCDMKIWQHLS